MANPYRDASMRDEEPAIRSLAPVVDGPNCMDVVKVTKPTSDSEKYRGEIGWVSCEKAGVFQVTFSNPKRCWLFYRDEITVVARH